MCLKQSVGIIVKVANVRRITKYLRITTVISNDEKNAVQRPSIRVGLKLVYCRRERVINYHDWGIVKNK